MAVDVHMSTSVGFGMEAGPEAKTRLAVELEMEEGSRRLENLSAPLKDVLEASSKTCTRSMMWAEVRLLKSSVHLNAQVEHVQGEAVSPGGNRPTTRIIERTGLIVSLPPETCVE